MRPHLLTIALEDYFQVAPLQGVVGRSQWHRFEARVQVNTGKVLDLLDEFGTKATFFVVGWIADEMPEVVRQVVERGHEVASKGYHHRGIRQLSAEEFREDLVRSREAIERAAGTVVRGYRVAHGWFGPGDLWALDVLAEEGLAYDSSIRPLFGAFARQTWRRSVHAHRSGEGVLWEFPVSTWRLGGWAVPIAGGNYLRHFPHAWMKRAVAKWDKRGESPLLMSFHVWDLDPEQPRISAAPLRARLHQYRNLEKMEAIIRYYLGQYRFIGIRDFMDSVGLESRAVRLGSDRQAASRSVASETTAGRRAKVPRPSEAESSPYPREAITVVVPCYNEELILPYLAKTLSSLKSELGEYDLRFLFVDDGSVDGTPATLRQIFGSWADSDVVSHEANRGVAAAILTGIRKAETEIVCSIDCDCSYDPHQLRALLPMLGEDVDMVTASPYHPAGRVRNVRFWRLLLSKGLSALYRAVLRQRLCTYTSCFRVYRRDAVAGLPVRDGGFLGVAETLALLDLRGGRIVECPAVLEARLLGRSKMRTFRIGVGHLLLLFRLALLRLKSSRKPPASSEEVRNRSRRVGADG